MIEKGIHQKLEIQVIPGVSIPDQEDYQKERSEQIKKASRPEGARKSRGKGTTFSSGRKPNDRQTKRNSSISTSGGRRTR